MLTKINKRIADEQRGNPNGIITVQVPYLTHTLRAKVYLGMNQFMKKYGKSLYVKRRILRVVVELHGRLASSNIRPNLVGTTQVIGHILEMAKRISFQMNYILKFTLTVDGWS